MKRPATIILFTLLLMRLEPAGAQLVDAECSAWPEFPFAETEYLESAQRVGFDPAWREFSARDAVRNGQPPAPTGSAPSWIWHADLAAVARSSDLGLFVSRFNEFPRVWGRGVTDGYIVSAWAFVGPGSRKLIASTWLSVKNDLRPMRPGCLRLRPGPGVLWSSLPRTPKVRDIAAAVPPTQALRDADNALIAQATCRDRWASLIAASGEDHGWYLLPDVGEVFGGASLRAIVHLIPDTPVRWQRLKFIESRDGTLGLSIGRIVGCDDENARQTYVSAWIRDGKAWRLELHAIAP